MHDMAMHGDCAQGRPKDGPEDKYRLNPVVPRLQELLGSAKVGAVMCCCIVYMTCGAPI